MSEPQLYVHGLGVWTDGFPGLAAFRARHPEPPPEKLKAPILDRQCARRASPFAKAMALAFAEATETVAENRNELSAVFGSCLGETSVMLKLLEQMIRGEDDFSPMLFAVSVHNAASGLVSISTKNQAFTTSVAADHDTPAMALFEAYGVCVELGRPTAIVCGDEAAPEGLVGAHEAFGGVAAALLVHTEAGENALAKLSLPRVGGDGHHAPDLPPDLIRNPQSGLLNLIDAVAEGRNQTVALDHGKGRSYKVGVEAC